MDSIESIPEMDTNNPAMRRALDDNPSETRVLDGVEWVIVYDYDHPWFRVRTSPAHPR